MELVPCGFSDFSNVKHSFSRCKVPTSSCVGVVGGTVLVAAFQGSAGNSHQDIGTFAFMNAMIVAGLEAWRPEALVLDLRELRYSWGDEMSDTLTLASGKKRRTFPTAVVVSDLNRTGLTSLINQEMDGDPRQMLFETIEDAVAAVDRQQHSEPGTVTYG